MARNRIIYGSQSVWCNGEVLLRVQTLGSTTTFTNEDIFELGHLDIVDVVDDVPAVAVTINTNDWGDVKTMAVLAQLPSAKLDMDATAIDSNANLTVISGSIPDHDWLHGVSLADFAVTCGALPGVTLWAPVQDECSLGDYLVDEIDQTLFMDEVYVNSLEFSYTTGANATENYGAETDQKMWLLNEGRFVNYETWDDSFAAEVLTIEDTNAAAEVVELSNGLIGFLRKTEAGEPGVTVYIDADNEVTNWPVTTVGAQQVNSFDYASGTNVLEIPSGMPALAAGDTVTAIYAADYYGTTTQDHYFRALSDLNDSSRVDIGAVRQGQVEIYIVSETDSDWNHVWRLTACTITADLTREALAELGHLGPYDRPLTLPVPITVTVDSTAGDLELWAKFADQYAEYLVTTPGSTLNDLDLADLMASDSLKLVVKIYAQTDEEAGGTGANRTLMTNSDLVGSDYFDEGTLGTYASDGEREWALKTIVVEHLKMTDEAYTLDLGANATQTFGFRSTNDLYVIKGDLSTLTYLQSPYRIRRNA